MPTNVFFNNFASSQEQNLIEDLIVESIKIYGQDMYYIRRAFGAKDDILNEDDLPTYDHAALIEMYIKNIDGFEGDGDFLSKFNLEIRDSMTLSVARRSFDINVTADNGRTRPLEGDLIYFPLNNKIFEIMHVEHESLFYQMGALQLFDIRVELFEFSNETFSTGVSAIDDLYAAYLTTSNTAIANVDSVDVGADNFEFQSEANTIIDFTESDPFSEGGSW